jgi:ADP-heptose:LPS heptosyltransferase
MNTFKHSGDLGDIIYSLPTIRALGGGILCLDPKGGENRIGYKTKLNSNSIKSIKDLLKAQSYIHDVVEWNYQPIRYDLDKFRNHLKYNNLCDSHLAAFDLSLSEKNTAWLAIDPLVIKDKPIIFSRSCRYQSNHLLWEYLCNSVDLSKVLFIGHRKEHEIFELAFNIKVDYLETPNLLDAARVIAGCDEVFCNPSVIHAIAQGFHKNITLEVFRLFPSTMFDRPGVRNL